MKIKHALLTAAIALAPATANAAPTIFNFTGTIASSYSANAIDAGVGSAFNGEFTYDPTSSPTGTFGIQNLYNGAAELGFSSVLGAAEGTGYINVLHDNSAGQDSFAIAAFTMGDYNLVNLATALSATPVNSPLPTSLAGQSFNFSTQGRDAAGFLRGFSGTIQVAAAPIAAAVPEPATWLTMIAGFGLVGFAMRQRRQRTTIRFA